MDTLRWALLGATELIFWLGLIAFFALRYGLKRPDLGRLVLVFVIAEHVALLVFGVYDLLRTGTWSIYQAVIAAANSAVSSASPTGRGALAKRRCCAYAPATSAGTSASP